MRFWQRQQRIEELEHELVACEVRYEDAIKTNVKHDKEWTALKKNLTKLRKEAKVASGAHMKALTERLEAMDALADAKKHKTILLEANLGLKKGCQELRTQLAAVQREAAESIREVVETASIFEAERDKLLEENKS